MKKTVDVTAVIAAIPPRVNGFLLEAVNGIHAQSVMLAGGISVALDVNREGAARTRQRAINGVDTEWIAFCDDDDFWYPHHIETLLKLQRETGADFLYSWFDGNNPFPMHRGRQFNPAEPHHTTMNVMVRTTIAMTAGFLLPNGPLHQDWMGEDWQFILRCNDLGAKFAGTPEITWHYRTHGQHTSGLPRW